MRNGVIVFRGLFWTGLYCFMMFSCPGNATWQQNFHLLDKELTIQSHLK